MVNFLDPSNYFKKAKDYLTGRSAQEIGSELSDDVLSAIDAANADYESIWSPLAAAAEGRSIKEGLDRFDAETAMHQQRLNETLDPSKRIDEFVNPMGEYQQQQIRQGIMGGAGNALQSSATEEAIDSALVANALQNYNSAAGLALSNAGQNLSVDLQQQAINKERLDNDMAPASDLIKFRSDWETDKLQSVVDAEKARAQLAAMDSGIAGDLGSFFTTLASAKSNNKGQGE